METACWRFAWLDTQDTRGAGVVLHNWRGGRRVALLGASEHAAGLLCDCAAPGLVPYLGKQSWTAWSCLLCSFCLSKPLQPKHGCFDSGDGKQQSPRLVVLSPWCVLGYVNNARSARGFQEVLDYSVECAPRVLFLKPCTTFIYTLLVSLSLQLCSLPWGGVIFKSALCIGAGRPPAKDSSSWCNLQKDYNFAGEKTVGNLALKLFYSLF